MPPQQFLRYQSCILSQQSTVSFATDTIRLYNTQYYE